MRLGIGLSVMGWALYIGCRYACFCDNESVRSGIFTSLPMPGRSFRRSLHLLLAFFNSIPTLPGMESSLGTAQPPPAHPAEATVVRFATGDATPKESALVVRHLLAGCPHCGRVLVNAAKVAW
jgi:hypothetical protein